jgi:Taurine catabolism dioxygenase TauD, TfdA family
MDSNASWRQHAGRTRPMCRSTASDGLKEPRAMSASSLRSRSLGPVAATEITGVDLAAPLDERAFAEIEAAFDRSGAIVIRDQRITPVQQLATERGKGTTVNPGMQFIDQRP